MPDLNLITTPDELTRLAAALPAGGRLGVDTEFLRERTYYPILCLIQINDGQRLTCVDTLSTQDLAPLADILARPATTTIFHAARQDLEVLFLATGRLPGRLFDTQIAAALLGDDAQVSYGHLVAEFLGVNLPKGHARTDWTRRPLSDDQLRYAADDVRYLPPLCSILSNELERRGRLGWLEAECRALLDPSAYTVDPDTAWRRVRGTGRLAPEARGILRRLAAWREDEAIDRNRPRGWILQDALLLELSQKRPRSSADLAQIRGMPPAVVRRYGDILLQLIHHAEQLHVEGESPSGPLSADERRLAKELRNLLNRIAAEEGLSPAILSNKKDLERLARGRRDVSVLRGWRREVAGDRLLTYLDG